MPDKLTAAYFKPLINETFTIQDDKNSVQMELIEVTEKNQDEVDSSIQSFSILFRGPKDKMLPQGIYRVDHEKIDTLDLFLVPVGPDQTGLCYEAVFNYMS